MSDTLIILNCGVCKTASDLAGDDEYRLAGQVASIVVIERLVPKIFKNGFKD